MDGSLRTFIVIWMGNTIRHKNLHSIAQWRKGSTRVVWNRAKKPHVRWNKKTLWIGIVSTRTDIDTNMVRMIWQSWERTHRKKKIYDESLQKITQHNIVDKIADYIPLVQTQIRRNRRFYGIWDDQIDFPFRFQKQIRKFVRNRITQTTLTIILTYKRIVEHKRRKIRMNQR
jgi:hypothetical protein